MTITTEFFKAIRGKFIQYDGKLLYILTDEQITDIHDGEDDSSAYIPVIEVGYVYADKYTSVRDFVTAAPTYAEKIHASNTDVSPYLFRMYGGLWDMIKYWFVWFASITMIRCRYNMVFFIPGLYLTGNMTRNVLKFDLNTMDTFSVYREHDILIDVFDVVKQLKEARLDDFTKLLNED